MLEVIEVSIDITCRSRAEAEDVLCDIARDIGNGRFNASCSKAVQDEFRGSVFVCTRNDESPA